MAAAYKEEMQASRTWAEQPASWPLSLSLFLKQIRCGSGWKAVEGGMGLKQLRELRKKNAYTIDLHLLPAIAPKNNTHGGSSEHSR